MTISLNSLLTTKVKDNSANSIKIRLKKVRQKSDIPYTDLDQFSEKIDWDKLVDCIFKDYLESYIGRLIVPTESMLKIYFLQHQYNLTAPHIEKSLKEDATLRKFALEIDVIPDASSIQAFADLIKAKNLTKTIEEEFSNRPQRIYTN